MAAPQQQRLPELPRECFEAIVQRLPPNCIPLAIRPLSKELRQRYHSHTRVAATGDNYVPEWAMVVAAPHVWKHALMNALARRGYLEAMRQLAEQHTAAYSQLVESSTLYQAARGGHLHVVRWLVEDKGCRDGSYGAGSCAHAATYGHLHVLQYLVAQQPPFACGADVYLAAARCGHVATLQWLRQNGCGWSSSVAAAAAGAGQLAALRWLVEQGCPLGVGNGNDCAKQAAAGGYWGVLQFLRQKKCVWTAGVAEKAALAGKVQTLRWLRANGCPWDRRCWVAAVSCGHMAVLEALEAGRCSWDGIADTLPGIAVQKGRANVLRWLGEHGCAMTDATLCRWAAGIGDVDLLQWLKGKGSPWDSSC